MKSITLNKNSWHYWLVDNIRMLHDSSLDNIEEFDLCTYSRLVLLSLFFTFVYIIGVFLFAVVITASFIPLVSAGIAGNIIAIIFLVLISISINVLLFRNYIAEYIDKFASKRSDRKSRNKKDNFLKFAYTGWKEKYCIKITFKDR